MEKTRDMSGKLKALLNSAKKKAVDLGTAASPHAQKVRETVAITLGRARVEPGTVAAFLSLPELLKWTEKLSKSKATIYDKALDKEYLETHVGGANHRLFDGGHDLVSAWRSVQEASETDSFQQQVAGYASALWKDVTTTKGLPFTTLDKSSYDAWVEKVTDLIPGLPKSYLYDLVTFDAVEVLSSGLGAVAILFALSKDDVKKVSEILGAMGVTSICAGNPIMLLVAVAITAYAYAVKKQKIDPSMFAKGGTVASVSMILFTVMGLPILIELVVVLVVANLFRKYVLDRKQLLQLLSPGLARLKKADVARFVSRIRGGDLNGAAS